MVVFNNKKGAEMTIGTIVVIILAVLVLVFLVFGFSQGWGNLFDKVFNLGGQANVDTIKTACQVACTTQAKYDFCSVKRNIIFDKSNKAEGVTCKDLSGDDPNAKEATEGTPATPAIPARWQSPIVEVCSAINCAS